MKKSILFIAPKLSSFVLGDIKLLKTQYNVIVNIYKWENKYLLLFNILRHFFLLISKIWTIKAIVISFGGYWALIPTIFSKIFNVPSFIILHGTDCVSIPSIKYGSLRSFLMKKACSISYKNASLLLPVSDSLIFTKNDYYFKPTDKEYLQGILHFFPKLKTPSKVIYNGIDSDFWICNSKKVPNTFISVISENQFFLKGGDLIIELSRKKIDCKFYIAGSRMPYHIKEDLPNVIFLGKLTPKELKHYFSISQYYLQLSIFEGFGCSLAEAMLCDCIPIGSSVNIIPNIINKEELIVSKKNIDILITVINYAVKNKDSLLNFPRKQIIENYNYTERKNKLINIIERFIK